MKWMTISGLFIILALRFVCWDTLFVCVFGGVCGSVSLGLGLVGCFFWLQSCFRRGKVEHEVSVRSSCAPN